MSPFGSITIIDPCSSPTLVRLAMILHPCFLLILSTFYKVLYCCKIQILKETFATLLRRTQLTYQPSLMLLSTFMLGRTASQMNLKHIRHFFKEFRDIFSWSYEEMLGIDPSIVVTKLKLIPRLNLSGTNLGKSILGRPHLSKLRLKNL